MDTLHPFRNPIFPHIHFAKSFDADYLVRNKKCPTKHPLTNDLEIGTKLSKWFGMIATMAHMSTNRMQVEKSQ
jgi:hypothetical protein